MTEETFESPCIRNCCLDENDICLGCFRSLSEITSWASLTQQEQKAVLEKAKLRAANRQQ